MYCAVTKSFHLTQFIYGFVLSAQPSFLCCVNRARVFERVSGFDLFCMPWILTGTWHARCWGGGGGGGVLVFW